jgi:hypothetical protein
VGNHPKKKEKEASGHTKDSSHGATMSALRFIARRVRKKKPHISSPSKIRDYASSILHGLDIVKKKWLLELISVKNTSALSAKIQVAENKQSHSAMQHQCWFAERRFASNVEDTKLVMIKVPDTN